MRGPAVEIDRIVREVLAELPRGRSSAPSQALGRASANGRAVVGTAQPPARTRRAVITLGDLDGRLDGEPELVVPSDAIVTPSVRDHLKERGIRLKRAAVERDANPATANERPPVSAGSWGYVIVQGSGLAEGAIHAVARQGTPLVSIAADGFAEAIRTCAEGIAHGRVRGAIVFCDDAALAACAANMRPGVRAVVGESAQQVTRVLQSLAANVLVVEPAGKTLHELRNVLRAFCSSERSPQPSPDVVELLGER